VFQSNVNHKRLPIGQTNQLQLPKKQHPVLSKAHRMLFIVYITKIKALLHQIGNNGFFFFQLFFSDSYFFTGKLT
jgi:hypothetical protein